MTKGLKLIRRSLMAILLISLFMLIYQLYPLFRTDDGVQNNDSNYITSQLDMNKIKHMHLHKLTPKTKRESGEGLVHSLTNNTQDKVIGMNIHVLLIFTNVNEHSSLRDKFSTMIKSLLEKTSVTIVFHIIGDSESVMVGEKIVWKYSKTVSKQFKHQVKILNIEQITKVLNTTITDMQHHFTSSRRGQYSDPLFFISIALHRVFPDDIHRLIMLDADLLFHRDIKHLQDLFSKFSDTNVIGLAYEQSPVYRHMFEIYRKHHKGTKVGDPPPTGRTGFNSGVVLLDLHKMRKSQLYNDMITAETVDILSSKFNFKGHLGDQDLFSLISMEHPDLFHVLPCSWNRQLCLYWKKSYKHVFDDYFVCNETINIYHGNCNTPFPKT